MVEKFKMNTGFIERLHLPSGAQKAILDYHAKKNGYTAEDYQGDVRMLGRGVLDTYAELLLIARTPYYSTEVRSGRNLSYEHPRWREGYFGYFAAGPAPQGLERCWEGVCSAFLNCGYLRPVAMDERCLVWPEIDFVFRHILENYAGSDLRLTDSLVIGCFNPRNHEEYEAFDRVLSYNDAARLVRYLHAKFPSYARSADCLLNIPGEVYRSGDFERSILAHDDDSFRRMLGQTEILRDINRIYLGKKVAIEI